MKITKSLFLTPVLVLALAIPSFAWFGDGAPNPGGQEEVELTDSQIKRFQKEITKEISEAEKRKRRDQDIDDSNKRWQKVQQDIAQGKRPKKTELLFPVFLAPPYIDPRVNEQAYRRSLAMVSHAPEGWERTFNWAEDVGLWKDMMALSDQQREMGFTFGIGRGITDIREKEFPSTDDAQRYLAALDFPISPKQSIPLGDLFTIKDTVALDSVRAFTPVLQGTGQELANALSGIGFDKHVEISCKMGGNISTLTGNLPFNVLVFYGKDSFYNIAFREEKTARKVLSTSKKDNPSKATGKTEAIKYSFFALAPEWEFSHWDMIIYFSNGFVTCDRK